MNIQSPSPVRNKPPWIHVLCAGLVAALVLRFLPSTWCARDSAGWMRGDRSVREPLAQAVENWVLRGGLSSDSFHNPDDLFNQEWFFGSYFAAGVGFAQIALQEEAGRGKNLGRALRCADHLLQDSLRAFDTQQWGEDALASLDGNKGHAAYLGYFNLLLSLVRCVDRENRHADLNDRITAALVRRLGASSIGLLETYPLEVYPVDNSMVIGSIALHQRATGQDHSVTVSAWVKQVRSRYLDPATGLLIQSVYAQDGRPLDAPRGSGTALSFLGVHYADPALAADLYRAMRTHLHRSFLGFGAMREYPPGVPGRGDIDSGPVVMGIGLSATGFALSGARMHGDAGVFRSLFASAHLFGAPTPSRHGRAYLSGGALGNAILLAMLTAPQSPSPAGGTP